MKAIHSPPTSPVPKNGRRAPKVIAMPATMKAQPMACPTTEAARVAAS